MATTIGNLAIQLSANPAALIAGLNQASAAMDRFGQRARRNLTGLGGGPMGLGGTGVGAAPGAMMSLLPGGNVISGVASEFGTLGRSAYSALTFIPRLAANAFTSLALLGIKIQGLYFTFQGFAKLMAPIRLAAEIESIATQFGVLLGNAQAGEALVQTLRDMAVVTPFTSRGIMDAARTVMAYGIEADKLVPTMEVLGDIALGDADRFQRLALAFGQVRAHGKLMGQEVLQFANAGVNITEALSQTLGVSTEKIKEMQKAGLISFNDVARALEDLTKQGGRFFEGMEKGSRTIEGKWSSLKDLLSITFTNIGQAMVEAFDIKGALDGLNEFLLAFKDKVKPWLMPIFEWIKKQWVDMKALVLTVWDEAIVPLFTFLSETLKDWGVSMDSSNDDILEWLETIIVFFARIYDSMKALGGAWYDYWIEPLKKAVMLVWDVEKPLVDLAKKLSGKLIDFTVDQEWFKKIAGMFEKDLGNPLKKIWEGGGEAEAGVRGFFDRVRDRAWRLRNDFNVDPFKPWNRHGGLADPANARQPQWFMAPADNTVQKSAEAATKGSKEAYSAILNWQKGDGDRAFVVQNRILAEAQQIKKRIEEGNRLFEEWRKIAEPPKPVGL